MTPAEKLTDWAATDLADLEGVLWAVRKEIAEWFAAEEFARLYYNNLTTLKTRDALYAALRAQLEKQP